MSLPVGTVPALLEAQPYLLLFPLVLLEGPIATVSAGLLVAAGLIGWPAAYAVAVAADLSGDTLYYLLGRSARRPRAGRSLARLGLTEEKLAAMGAMGASFGRNDAKAIVGAKVMDFAAIPVFVAAIAHAAVYLASDEAAFVHGTVIDVDGGRVGVAVFGG